MLSKPEISPYPFEGKASHELRILVAGVRHVAQVFDSLEDAQRTCRFLGLIQEAIEMEEGK